MSPVLPPEVHVAYRRWLAINNIDAHSFSSQVFADGFLAGRTFQHDQLRRVLCKDCLIGLPLIKDAPIPTHIVNPDGQRRTCQARELAAFEPK